MTELLAGLLGKYVLDTYSFVLLFWQCEFCMILFLLRHKRRKYFIPRLAACMVAGTGLCLLFAIANTEMSEHFPYPLAVAGRVLCYNAVSALNLVSLPVCFRESAAELLLCWCSGMACYQVVMKLYPLLLNIAGVDDKQTISFLGSGHILQWYDWAIYLSMHILFYIVLAFVFRRKDFLYKDSATSRSIVIVSVITTVFVHGLVCVARLYEDESFALNIIIKVFCIAFGLGVLFICTEIYSRNRSHQEMNVIRQMWKQEQSQFASIKANIDYINSKCHDLKHIFNKLDDKLDEADFARLKEAVDFYDSSVRTGNEALDIVLCEKSTLCTGRDIKFTCMADGGALGMLSVSEIYSLFGNIMDNAIEASSAIGDKERRVISLTVVAKHGHTLIDAANFYDGSRNAENGELATNKEDPYRHGYGLKSIRYIVSRHGGETSVTAKDGRFELKIVLPAAAAQATPPPQN